MITGAIKAKSTRIGTPSGVSAFVRWEDNPSGAIVNWHPMGVGDVFSGQTP